MAVFLEEGFELWFGGFTGKVSDDDFHCGGRVKEKGRR